MTSQREPQGGPDLTRLPQSIVGLGVTAAQRLLRAARARIAADHRTIHSRRYRADMGNVEGFKVHIAFAPARRIRPGSLVAAREGVELLARSAAALAGPARPAFAQDDFVRYVVEPAHVLEIRSNGLVELVWQVTTSVDSDDAPSIDLADVAVPVLRMATAASIGLDRRIFGRRSGRRLDWHFNLNAYVSTSTGQLSWRTLRAGGELFSGWGEAPPYAPIEGYGGSRLWNRRRRKNPRELALSCLRALATANGFSVPMSALEAAVDEASKVLDAQTAHCQDRPCGEPA